jgi:hypothetical protein
MRRELTRLELPEPRREEEVELPRLRPERDVPEAVLRLL